MIPSPVLRPNHTGSWRNQFTPTRLLAGQGAGGNLGRKLANEGQREWGGRGSEREKDSLSGSP